jgi:hypothetical protein
VIIVAQQSLQDVVRSKQQLVFSRAACVSRIADEVGGASRIILNIILLIVAIALGV